jgi:DNA-binding NarL/FixJ family response regulator
MVEFINAELRAALRDDKRVSVAISEGAGTQGLRVLIDAVAPPRKAKSASRTAKTLSLAVERPEGRATPLTTRELQVLKLIAKGLHNRQIAARIHRSIKTVEKHRQNLHSKLSTHEVAGLTRHALAMGLTDKTQRGVRALAKSAKKLTKRELEVLKLVAEGSGNKWIASELRRSIKTVDHHRENIMKKLGIHEVAGLTRHALAIGLL